MTAADGIRKLGFRRWYERQLIESHVYLVTGFLSMIMVFACFEDFSLRAPGIKPFLMLALIMGGAVLCAVSLWRYLSSAVTSGPCIPPGSPERESYDPLNPQFNGIQSRLMLWRHSPVPECEIAHGADDRSCLRAFHPVLYF